MAARVALPRKGGRSSLRQALHEDGGAAFLRVTGQWKNNEKRLNG